MHLEIPALEKALKDEKGKRKVREAGDISYSCILQFEGKDSPWNLHSSVVISLVHTWRFSSFKRRNETDPLYPCFLCYKRETSCAIQGSNTLHSPLVNCHCQQHVQMCSKGSCALAGGGHARSANMTADKVKQQSEEALGGMLLEDTGLKMPGRSALWCPGCLFVVTDHWSGQEKYLHSNSTKKPFFSLKTSGLYAARTNLLSINYLFISK